MTSDVTTIDPFVFIGLASHVFGVPSKGHLTSHESFNKSFQGFIKYLQGKNVVKSGFYPEKYFV